MEFRIFPVCHVIYLNVSSLGALVVHLHYNLFGIFKVMTTIRNVIAFIKSLKVTNVGVCRKRESTCHNINYPDMGMFLCVCGHVIKHTFRVGNSNQLKYF